MVQHTDNADSPARKDDKEMSEIVPKEATMAKAVTFCQATVPADNNDSPPSESTNESREPDENRDGENTSIPTESGMERDDRQELSEAVRINNMLVDSPPSQRKVSDATINTTGGSKEEAPTSATRRDHRESPVPSPRVFDLIRKYNTHDSSSHSSVSSGGEKALSVAEASRQIDRIDMKQDVNLGEFQDKPSLSNDDEKSPVDLQKTSSNSNENILSMLEQAEEKLNALLSKNVKSDIGSSVEVEPGNAEKQNDEAIVDPSSSATCHLVESGVSSVKVVSKLPVRVSCSDNGQTEEFDDEDPYYDRTSSRALRKRLRLQMPAVFCVVVVGLLVVAGAVALRFFINGQSRKKEESGMCTFCADGSIPGNLDNNLVGYETCSEFLKEQVLLSASGPLCLDAQIVTWRFCECPTLPPLSSSSSCKLCPDGSPPTTQFCQDLMTYLTYMYESDYSCEEIVSAAVKEGCGCPETQVPKETEPPAEEKEQDLSEPIQWESSRPGQKCTFCHDGSIPLKLIETNIGGQSCADYRVEVESYDATEPNCAQGQALAWLMCDCPALPSTPTNVSCSLCGEGVHLENEACDNINTFMEHVTDAKACTALVELVSEVGCTCPANT